MKSILILAIFVLLVSCSTTSTNKEINKNTGWIKFQSDQELSFIFQDKEYNLKPNVIEQVINVPKQKYFNITAYNDESYRTRNICYLNTTCSLSVQLAGLASVQEINRTAFNIAYKGDVRNALLCIDYKNLWWLGIDAVEVQVPNHLKRTIDNCYLAEQNKIYKVPEELPNITDPLSKIQYNDCVIPSKKDKAHGGIYPVGNTKEKGLNYTKCYIGTESRTYNYAFKNDTGNYSLNVRVISTAE